MRRFFTLFAVMVAVLVSSCAYDDTGLWNALNSLEQRVATLEELCKETNTNLSALQKIVEAISQNKQIKNIAPIYKDGAVVGYAITFTSGESVTIYNDNKQESAGAVPQIGVAKDNDGVYYWTLNGEWLLDANGNKIKAEGDNGLTPRFKIENEYWYVSYDNGINWDVLGKATADSGDCDCQSIIKGVEYDEEYVYITLADGTVLTLPRVEKPHEWVDLGLSVKWATCNVGANAPEEYGDYFAWGETSPKESYTDDNCLTYGVSMTDISGNPQYDAATANWGGTWRMPTQIERQELIESCSWEFIAINNVNGMRVTGPNGNSIFLPAAGYCDNVTWYDVGRGVNYWCSTSYNSSNTLSWTIYVNNNETFGIGWDLRSHGRSIRPVIDK
jgi:hypothetical protein